MLEQADAPWILGSSDDLTAASLEPARTEWVLDRLGASSSAIGAELALEGLELLTSDKLSQKQTTLTASACLIDLVPSLSSRVQSNVSNILLLAAEENFDISHSEPRWPGWIFVSVPNNGDDVAALRAAENIVHEAMHLQLTRLEAQTPLARDMERMMFSPWMEQPRSLQGILHGVYVFVCIAAFFERLLGLAVLSHCGEVHVRGRLESIARELNHLSLPTLAKGLTARGALFLSQLTDRRNGVSAMAPAAVFRD